MIPDDQVRSRWITIAHNCINSKTEYEIDHKSDRKTHLHPRGVKGAQGPTDTHKVLATAGTTQPQLEERPEESMPAQAKAAVPPTSAVTIPDLESPIAIDWELQELATAFHLTPGLARGLLCHKTLTPALIAGWLGNHGFTWEKAGGGHVVTSHNTGACYRLVFAVETLALVPSHRRRRPAGAFARRSPEPRQVDGWAVVFSCDLPNAPIYFVAERFAEEMQRQGVLDFDYKSKSGKVWRFLMDALGRKP
jgi:hypothetical protein